MIYASGHLKPLPSQVLEGWTRGNETFEETCSAEFEQHLPSWRGLQHAQNTVLLKLKHVEPHDDPWQAACSLEPSARLRRSFFWLLKGELHLQCGSASQRMKAGDWVVLNDALIHSVSSTKLWAGAAWQLLTKDQRAAALITDEEKNLAFEQLNDRVHFGEKLEDVIWAITRTIDIDPAVLTSMFNEKDHD